jgi:hypothetical protein
MEWLRLINYVLTPLGSSFFEGECTPDCPWTKEESSLWTNKKWRFQYRSDWEIRFCCSSARYQ